MNIEPVAYINVEERKLEWAGPVEWGTPTIAALWKVPLYVHQYGELTDEEIADLIINKTTDADMIKQALRKAQEK